jgi:AraC-like DNA-binding protein
MDQKVFIMCFLVPSNTMKRTHKITSLHHGSETAGIGRITTVARLEDSAGTPGCTLRTLQSYALVYVYEGHGWYRDELQRLCIQQGDLILVFPERPHAYGPEGNTPWNELFLLFDGNVFDLWQKEGLLDPSRPVLNLQPVEAWQTRFHEIYSASTPLRKICRLQSFLADALCDSDQTAEEKNRRWIAEANHRLMEHLRAADAPRQAAESMAISYQAFRKKYKRLTGTTPGRFCSGQIIEQAAKRIIETGLPIKTIAHEFGFCDEFYFSRRFKQITGLSPASYRHRLPRQAGQP